MHYMLCEIWEDADECGRAASPVTQQNDKVRVAYDPNAKLVHTFYAYSDHDFWRQVYKWDGRDEWQADPMYPEHFFTEEEVDEQQQYLQLRGTP